jgi:hypothetical protein
VSDPHSFVGRIQAGLAELEAANAHVKGLDAYGTIRIKLNGSIDNLRDLLGLVEEVNRIAPSDVSVEDPGVRTEADRLPDGEEADQPLA